MNTAAVIQSAGFVQCKNRYVVIFMRHLLTTLAPIVVCSEHIGLSRVRIDCPGNMLTHTLNGVESS